MGTRQRRCGPPSTSKNLSQLKTSRFNLSTVIPNFGKIKGEVTVSELLRVYRESELFVPEHGRRRVQVLCPSAPSWGSAQPSSGEGDELSVQFSNSLIAEQVARKVVRCDHENTRTRCDLKCIRSSVSPVANRLALCVSGEGEEVVLRHEKHAESSSRYATVSSKRRETRAEPGYII